MVARCAFILVGTGSGCGKTAVTLGLLSLLQQRGLWVQPYKAGPDYLDTARYTAISGVASCNLDSFMLPAPIFNALFAEQLQRADIAVIEGVMGLYDSYGIDSNYCSSAVMTKQFGCPMILLVDGKVMLTSIAATMMGFQHFDPAFNIAGVIANRANSEAHFQLLKSTIERYCQVPVLGYVPCMEGAVLPERYLGLVTAREPIVNQQTQRGFASLLGCTLDTDRLLALSELAAVPAGEWGEQLAADAGEGLTLALADDEALNFYYLDNLALSAHYGVKVMRFSPLCNRQLLACQMIWFGGGYPEPHAAGLSANHEMLAQPRAAYRRGVTIYAGCGGLIYLSTTLEVIGGERYAMAGTVPGHSRMGTRLTRFGYCETQAQQQTLLAAPGEWLRGYEFHYPDLSPATPAALACRKQRDDKTSQQWPGGWQPGSALTSYLRVHSAQRPIMLNY